MTSPSIWMNVLFWANRNVFCWRFSSKVNSNGMVWSAGLSDTAERVVVDVGSSVMRWSLVLVSRTGDNVSVIVVQENDDEREREIWFEQLYNWHWEVYYVVRPHSGINIRLPYGNDFAGFRYILPTRMLCTLLWCCRSAICRRNSCRNLLPLDRYICLENN